MALRQDTKYIELRVDARTVKITLNMSEKAQDRLSAGSIYAGSYMDACMKQEGFTYGKLAPDQVYVPPPPPREGWIKPDVSYMQAHRTSIECYRSAENSPEFGAAAKKNHYQLHIYLEGYTQECMAKQGFVYRELTEDELPPCSYVMFPPCRSEDP